MKSLSRSKQVKQAIQTPTPGSSTSELVNRYRLAGQSGSTNTQRARKSDLAHYNEWCAEHRVDPAPCTAQQITEYLVHCADHYKWSTIQRRYLAVRSWHQSNGFAFPARDGLIDEVLEGIKRVKGTAQKQAPAFGLEEITALLKGFDITRPQQLRDKLVLLMGFMGAFRRSELVALNWSDLTFGDGQVIIRLRRSKTNQEGAHEEKALFEANDPQVCPLGTLKQWLSIQRGGGRPVTDDMLINLPDYPIFTSFRRGKQLGEVLFTPHRLSDNSVYNLVKVYLGSEYSAHSLRASFVTIAKLNGADDGEVMQQTKHKSSDMIRRYTRVSNVVQFNAGKRIEW